MKEYFVYRLRNDETYGGYVYKTDTLEKAITEAKAHKEATDSEYGVFERVAIWSTYKEKT